MQSRRSTVFFVLATLGVLVVGSGNALALDSAKLQRAAAQNKIAPAQMEQIINGEAAKAGISPDQLLDRMLGAEPAPAGASGGSGIRGGLAPRRKAPHTFTIGVGIYYLSPVNVNGTYVARNSMTTSDGTMMPPAMLPSDGTSLDLPKNLMCSPEGTPMVDGKPYQVPTMAYGVTIPSPCVPSLPQNYLMFAVPEIAFQLDGPVELLGGLLIKYPLIAAEDKRITNGATPLAINLGLRYDLLWGWGSLQAQFIRELTNELPGISPNQFALGANIHVWKLVVSGGAIMPFTWPPHEHAFWFLGATYEAR
jgi:hypothetical protein